MVATTEPERSLAKSAGRAASTRKVDVEPAPRRAAPHRVERAEAIRAVELVIDGRRVPLSRLSDAEIEALLPALDA